MNRIGSYENLETRIVNWLKDYYWMHSGKIKGFVVGVSGGIDSSVVSTLCAKTKLPTYILTMPLLSKRKNTELSNHRIRLASVRVLVLSLLATSEPFKQTIHIKI